MPRIPVCGGCFYLKLKKKTIDKSESLLSRRDSHITLKEKERDGEKNDDTLRVVVLKIIKEGKGINNKIKL